MDGGDASQGRAGTAGKGNERNPQALDRRNDGEDLRGFAGVGQGEHGILAGDHAHVSMACLARMHEEGGRTGARQGGGDFAADMPRFAHAGDHHAPAAVKTNPTGTCKLSSQAGDLGSQALDFDVERLASEIDEPFVRIVRIHRRMIQLEGSA
jgi:hypothetical protein